MDTPENSRGNKFIQITRTFECPECGSEYRPEKELNGELLTFAGDSVDMFSRATDPELIEELEKRGYQVEKMPAGVLKEE